MYIWIDTVLQAIFIFTLLLITSHVYIGKECDTHYILHTISRKKILSSAVLCHVFFCILVSLLLNFHAHLKHINAHMCYP